MRYYLGPYRSVEIEPGRNGYVAPWGAVGSLDLRTEADPTSGRGFFALPDDAPVLPEPYVLLGQGHVASLVLDAAAKTAWEQTLGVVPAHDTLLDVLWQTCTVDADASGASRVPPLMPTSKGVLELHLGGHSLIRSKRFAMDIPEAVPVVARLKRGYRALREKALRGEINGDRDFHRRVLQVWAEKYRVSEPQDVFVPDDLPRERPLPHNTTITESFNTADSDTLGPDLTWSEIEGDFDVVSNAAESVIGPSVAYAVSALSSDDHYVQVDVLQDTGYPGVIARKENNSTQTFYYWRHRDTATPNAQLFRVSSGSFTQVGSTVNITVSPTFSLKLQCDGSTIKGFIDGVERISETSAHISGATHVYCGMRQGNASGNTLRQDNFEAADLAGGGATVPRYPFGHPFYGPFAGPIGY